MSNPLFVDNTILVSVARCSTLDVTRHGLGLVATEERATLRSGTAIHEALAVWFRGGTHDEAMAALDASYREFAEEHVQTTDRLAWDNVRRIIDFWLVTHPLSALPFTIDPAMVEIGFAFPLTDEGDIVFCGRLDALAAYNGGLYTVENKSTWNVSRDWLSTFANDSQLSGYTWAAMQHAAQPVVGTMLNAIEISKIPDSDRRCDKHATPYYECGHLHNAEKHQIVIPTRSPIQIEEWRKTAIHLARKHADLIRRFQELKDIQKVRTQGTFNGHCRFCAFNGWCVTGRTMEYALNNFIFEPWSPYDRVTVERQHTAMKP